METITRKGRLYTIVELALLLGVTPMTIYRWMKEDGKWYKPELKATYIGDLIRFHERDILRFAKKLKKEVVLDK